MRLSRFLIIVLFCCLVVSSNLFAQSKCDTSMPSFVLTEILPETHLTFAEIEDYLNSRLVLSKYNTHSNLTPLLGFEINCHGETFNYETRSIKDTLLAEHLIYIFKNDFKWKPAYQYDKPVDFVISFSFDFSDDKIKIINRLDEMRRD
jgi:hypothetical protein